LALGRQAQGLQDQNEEPSVICRYIRTFEAWIVRLKGQELLRWKRKGLRVEVMGRGQSYFVINS